MAGVEPALSAWKADVPPWTPHLRAQGSHLERANSRSVTRSRPVGDRIRASTPHRGRCFKATQRFELCLLGYDASVLPRTLCGRKLKTRFELATPALPRQCSTT